MRALSVSTVPRSIECRFRSRAPAALLGAVLLLVPSVGPAAFRDISTYAGAGDGLSATAANLNVPAAVLQAGTDLYVADSTNQRIRKVNLAASPPTIATVAGNGTAGTSLGDGTVAALDASFYYPSGLARDAAGLLYFSDSYNGRILKIDAAQRIRLVAGAGPCCLTRDGGPAAGAFLNAPRGIAIDAARSLLYIADVGNSRVRRVDLSASPPTITTVAGNGVAAYAGDGLPATLASLKNPCVGLNPSGTALFIADTYNNAIRKVDLDPASLTYGVISTVAGTGAAGSSRNGGAATSATMTQPMAVAADGVGNVYIADSGNQRVRKVNAAGTISALVGTGTYGFSGDGGAATAARLANPFGLALDLAQDGSGSALWIADTFNQRVRRVDLTQSPPLITTVAGSGNCCLSGDGLAATVGDFKEPRGIAADVDGAGNLRALYIVAHQNNLVRKVDSSGVITTAVGGDACDISRPPDIGPPTDANLCSPWDVAADVVGGSLRALYIADTGRNVIRKVDYFAPFPVITTIAGVPYADGVGATHYDGDCGPATSAHLWSPRGVAFNATSQYLYIADTNNNRVRRVDLDPASSDYGEISTVGGHCGVLPSPGLGTARIQTAMSLGAPSVNVDDLRDGLLLKFPYDVVVDPGLGLLYVADTYWHRVFMLDAWTGQGVRIAGTGDPGSGYCSEGWRAWNSRLWWPEAVALASTGNILYIADTYNYGIRKVNLDHTQTSTFGEIRTVAGCNGPGLSGDGGQARLAKLGSPGGVATSATDLYVADTYNHRVRKVEGLP
jgi:sugar lactone lactonase YvrE